MLVRSFDLLHVKPDRADALLPIKLVKLVRIIEAFAGQDGDHMKGDALRAQELHPLDNASMRSLAAARATVAIMQKGGSVDADADPHIVRLDERAPICVDQRAVGLKRVLDVHA